MGDDVLEEGACERQQLREFFFWEGFIEGITNAIPLKVLALASVCVHQRLLRPMIDDGTEMDEVKIIQWDPFGWTLCMYYSIKFFIDVRSSKIKQERNRISVHLV